MPPSVVDQPWYVHAFGPLYLTVYGHRDDAEARRNAPRIARLLGLKPHARILDLACGEGRYTRAFAAMGHQVTGLDLSEDLLAEAKARSPNLPGAPTYLRSDMREIPFFEQFEAVVSLFTSFGYFDDRTDDEKVLEGAARALVPGGRLLLDLPNPAQVRGGLVAANEEVRGKWHLRYERRMDDTTPSGPYVRKRIVVTDLRLGQVVGDIQERVRLYAPDELNRVLGLAGLEPEGARLGDFDGTLLSPTAPRLIRVARRPLGRRARRVGA